MEIRLPMLAIPSDVRHSVFRWSPLRLPTLAIPFVMAISYSRQLSRFTSLFTGGWRWEVAVSLRDVGGGRWEVGVSLLEVGEMFAHPLGFGVLLSIISLYSVCIFETFMAEW